METFGSVALGMVIAVVLSIVGMYLAFKVLWWVTRQQLNQEARTEYRAEKAAKEKEKEAKDASS